MNDLLYLVKFSYLFEFIGPTRLKRLVAFYGCAQNAWEKLDDRVLMELGLGDEVRSKFWGEKRRIEGKEIGIEELRNRGIELLSMDSSNYPKRLKEIYDPPYLLYVRGELKPEDDFAIAVVGSRKMSRYGLEAVQSLVPPLVQAGLTIVSGLALGVDAAAHRTALDYGGRTAAVLASGVDKITPTANDQLAKDIIKNGEGAVISEYPLGTDPQPFYFPVRNRIISGLSFGVLVIEAAEESGALITARCALDQGREVFAVGGSIFSPMSIGTNKLIKDGAKMVTSAGDILEELDLGEVQEKVEARKAIPGSVEEEKILLTLEEEEKHVDEITAQSGLSPSVVSSTLTVMEIKGMIRSLGAGTYRRI